MHRLSACVSSPRSIIQGKPNPLLSSFKLSYYTLLNLMRRMEGSGGTMEHVIANSFAQFQHERSLPQKQERLQELQLQAAGLGADAQAAAAEYNELTSVRLPPGPCQPPPVLCMHRNSHAQTTLSYALARRR